MRTTDFIRRFKTLSYQEQAELLNSLKTTLSESKQVLPHRHTKRECIDPKCKSLNLYKHGKQVNGGQRFRCQKCGKSFNELSGTTLHRTRKIELWDRFIGLMLESKSIRVIASELNITIVTAFEWRHKVLSSFENIFVKNFGEEVEIDPIYFRLNQKGRRSNLISLNRKYRGISRQQAAVLMTMDRKKTFDFKLVKFGKLYLKDLEGAIDVNKFKGVKTVYSDSEKSIIKYFKTLKVEHKTFVARRGHGHGKLHVNTLNNTKKRLNGWMYYHFNSVSTKYLKNYLNWFAVLEILKKKKDKGGKMWDYILLDNTTHARSMKAESNYQEFMKKLVA